MSGESQRRDSFEHVAVLLVEQGGGIDSMARVHAVLALDLKRLRGSRRDRGQGRIGSLVSGRQLQALDAEEYGLLGLGSGMPVEQDTLPPHLAGQSGESGWTAPAAL